MAEGTASVATSAASMYTMEDMDDAHESSDLPIERRVYQAMEQICREHGGARQYLQKMYPDKQSQMEFLATTIKELPLEPGTQYVASAPMQTVAPQDFSKSVAHVFHPLQFSFSDASSLKGHPDAKTTLLLTESILADGFITAGDTLLVHCTPVDSGFAVGEVVPAPPGTQPISALSIAYVKGSARMNTLLCILATLINDRISIAAVLRAFDEGLI